MLWWICAFNHLHCFSNFSLFFFFSLCHNLKWKCGTDYFNSLSNLIYAYIFAFYMFIQPPWHFPHLWSFILMAKIIENQAVIMYVHLVDEKSEDFRSSIISPNLSTRKLGLGLRFLCLKRLVLNLGSAASEHLTGIYASLSSCRALWVGRAGIINSFIRPRCPQLALNRCFANATSCHLLIT